MVNFKTYAMKPLILFLLFTIQFQSLFAQKTNISRQVFQKNYDGYMLMKEQKFYSALNYFNNALKKDPDAYFIYQNRAFCYLQLFDTLSAIKDYKTNLKYEPTNTESLYSLGNIHKKLKDSLNSVNYFIKAVNSAPKGFSERKLLLMNRFVGNYYRLHEKYDSALIYFNTVEILRPNNSSVHINKAVCYFGLDSINQFCIDLEHAYITGGAVNCYLLKSYCEGCNHLIRQKGKTDTLSRALDKRLMRTVQDRLIITE